MTHERPQRKSLNNYPPYERLSDGQKIELYLYFRDICWWASEPRVMASPTLSAEGKLIQMQLHEEYIQHFTEEDIRLHIR